MKDRVDELSFKEAFKSSLPIIFGYLPTGFAFGLMLVSSGYSVFTAFLMSFVIYAGAAQYLAIDFLANSIGFLQISIMTFLINSKHLFYGLSLLDDYRFAGLKKFYLIFGLTDEVYALLSEPNKPDVPSRLNYCFYITFICHMAWIISGVLGALFGTFISFNTDGMEFAMTALFIVILIDQFRAYDTYIPFIVGGFAGLFSLIFISKENMLLVSSLISISILIIMRSKIEKDEKI